MSDTPLSLTKLNYKELTQLAEFMEKMGLTEVEVLQGETSVRLCRNGSPQTAHPAVVKQVETPEPESKNTPKNMLTAPMVGTFYRAGSPEAEPYVKPGDKVKKGEIVGIIEAMKTMNPVEAEKAGVIKEVLIDNAQPIEFGEPLFVLED